MHFHFLDVIEIFKQNSLFILTEPQKLRVASSRGWPHSFINSVLKCGNSMPKNFFLRKITLMLLGFDGMYAPNLVGLKKA